MRKEVTVFRAIISVLCMVVLLISFMGSTARAASSSIKGSVKDAQTGEALPGATVMLKGTSIGTSTDLNGNYVVRNVPPGSYTIRVIYVGYEQQEKRIEIKDGVSLTLDFKLRAVGVRGREVVVTSQASGQNAAINEQLSSNKIMNVVSAAKIQELPDANAAESVGRLPGVFVLRSGGEGYKVVIRGLAPQYNEITINGIQMGSSDPNNRSTDLSMISSNMLAGIQVSKTVTPDMDANVIGGVVNFDLRQAQVKEPGVPQYSLLVQGGYNNLSDAYNKYNNYKYVGSVEDRLLNDKLGVFAQIDVERMNLTSNELSSSYTHFGNSTSQYVISGVSLFDIPRDKMLYNGALDLDYEYSGGALKLMNFLSSGTTNIQQRSESFSIGGNMLYYGVSGSSNILNTISNILDFQQKLPIFDLDIKLGHTYSETKSPNNWAVSFSQTSGGLSQFSSMQNVNPQAVVSAADRNFSETYLYYLNNTSSMSRSRAFTASLDLKTNVDLSDAVTAVIKFGGESRYVTRSYLFDEYDTAQLLNSGSALSLDNMINSYFSFPTGNFQIPITNFLDPTFSYGEFLNGNYTMAAPVSLGMMSQLAGFLRRNAQEIAQTIGPSNYGHDNYRSTIPNYSGHENPNAVYAMATLNVGPQITVIGGARYQTFQTSYTGVAGVTSPESYYAYNHYDTTITQYRGYWLPDITLRYKPLSWADVRLSYTNTLAYPSYSAFVPKIDLSGISVGWNNSGLVPAHSRNYDAYVSFYNNTIGLLTAGVFLKQISDMIYSWQFFVKGAGALMYLPQNLANFNPNATYQVYTYENNPYLNKVYGLELDWQTHFWYLPGVLSGLVLDVNYTHTKSKAQYPYVYSVSTGRTIQYIDTSFTDRLVDQPDNIFNLSLGFDYRGFSIRAAMVYQADIFTAASQWPQLRGYTAAYRRWDIAARQELPWHGIEVYGDLNNINGANDMQVIQGGPPTAIEDYGFTADLGLRWRL
ncbi:MAG: TonB-dependent receptor [Bacteroidetes bacterium]|nr:TonB-dependent receptor [Bacteroidota bacterium]